MVNETRNRMRGKIDWGVEHEMTQLDLHETHRCSGERRGSVLAVAGATGGGEEGDGISRWVLGSSDGWA